MSENQEPPLEGTCTIFDECHDTGPIMSKAKRRELEKKILKSFDAQNQEKDSWVIMPSNK